MAKKRRKSYVRFDEEAPNPKTRRWTVRSADGQHILGWISWYGAWKKYTFSAAAGSIFDWWCLVDVAKFCQRQTREHWVAVQEQSGLLS